MIAGYYVYTNFVLVKPNVASQNFQPTNYVTAVDGCDSDCQREIYDSIDGLRLEVSKNQNVDLTIVPTKTQASIQYVPAAKTKSTIYVPIPGSGIVLNTDWSDISGTDFYLSKSDFQGLSGVYFEANFRLQNGNGTASLRIYDKTHSIAPSGGELSVSSQTSTFVSSGPVYLWEGNNHYIVQAKSSTSDTTIFESGRLKITTEN